MSRGDVVEKIGSHVPAAQKVIGGRVPDRLEALSKKDYPTGRQINWHRQDDLFCLPYSTRTRLAAENANDEALRLRVLEGMRERARIAGA